MLRQTLLISQCPLFVYVVFNLIRYTLIFWIQFVSKWIFDHFTLVKVGTNSEGKRHNDAVCIVSLNKFGS